LALLRKVARIDEEDENPTGDWRLHKDQAARRLEKPESSVAGGIAGDDFGCSAGARRASEPLE
jgi:hypothetical protein